MNSRQDFSGDLISMMRIDFLRKTEKRSQDISEKTDKTEKMSKKALNSRGFSLTELLATILIMSIIFIAVDGGVIVAQRVYNEVRQKANAQILLSTTVNALTGELRSANNVSTTSGTSSLDYYYSDNYNCYMQIGQYDPNAAGTTTTGTSAAGGSTSGSSASGSSTSADTPGIYLQPYAIGSTTAAYSGDKVQLLPTGTRTTQNLYCVIDGPISVLSTTASSTSLTTVSGGIASFRAISRYKFTFTVQVKNQSGKVIESQHCNVLSMNNTVNAIGSTINIGKVEITNDRGTNGSGDDLTYYVEFKNNTSETINCECISIVFPEEIDFTPLSEALTKPEDEHLPTVIGSSTNTKTIKLLIFAELKPNQQKRLGFKLNKSVTESLITYSDASDNYNN